MTEKSSTDVFDGLNSEINPPPEAKTGVSAARAAFLKANFELARDKIARAAAVFGGGHEVTLLAATKNVPAEEINYAAEHLGLATVGENRVQELVAKYGALDREKLDIQFIGSLQTNKVKYIIDKVSLIHSLDSLRLAAEIDRQAAKRNMTMDTLVEINIGGEASKGGVLPDELAGFLDGMKPFERVRVRGLMTMAPVCADTAEYKKYFEKTYRIFIDILQKRLHNIDGLILSMGMSDSFVPAVECGSTMVRLGGALFGDVRNR